MTRQTLSLLIALLSFALLQTAAAPTAHGQQPSAIQTSSPSWTITVDPLTTALGFAHLHFERRLSGHWTASSGPNLRLYDNIFSSLHEPYHGYGAEVGMRFFPFGKAPSGLWLMSRGVGARTVMLDPENPLKGWAGYGSGLIGYTFIPWNWLVLSTGVGVQYLRYGISEYGVRGLAPALHTALGIAF